MTQVILFLTLIFFLPISTFAELSELSKIGSKYDNEKGIAHDYLEIYNQYFSPIKNKKLKLLEIGFATGTSAYMWEEYFQQAELHYIDLWEGCEQYAKNLSNHSFLHIGDQADGLFLSKLVNQVGEFDIIIDDGSHQVDHQIFSFEHLFPHVKSGGVYVIEDLHTSYWEDFGGIGRPGNPYPSINSTTEYLKSLIDHVNFVGAYTGCANRELAKVRIDTGKDQYGTYNYRKDFFSKIDFSTRDIKSIHFYDSICFIFKR